MYNTDGSISPVTGIPTDRRGFTGHEMLDELGLVHMNGRVYDPIVGRFLSPDPTIQFPEDMQSYNRYSYVRNNPLSVTDPTGYEEACGFWCSIGGFFTNGTTISAGSVGLRLRAPTTTEMFTPTGWATYPATASTFLTRTSTAGCVASNSCQKSWEPVKEFVGREYIPFTAAGESAAQYWADKAVDADKRGNAWGFYGYSIPGAAASLWTPTTAVDTFTTLAGARWGGAAQAKPSSFSSLSSEGLTPVTRWGRPGLESGDWVMKGKNTWWNYIRSFKWDPNPTNIRAPKASGETFEVPKSSVKWPNGWGIDGWWKGLFGQRKYVPPPKPPAPKG